MSGDGHRGHSGAGHELNGGSSAKSKIVSLTCAQWFDSEKYLQEPNPGSLSIGDFIGFANDNGPKRRGRPPKGAPRQSLNSTSSRGRKSDASKALATRSSRRNRGSDVNGVDPDGDVEMQNGVSHEAADNLNTKIEVEEPATPSKRNSPRSRSNINSFHPSDKDNEPNAGLQAEATNGHTTPTKTSNKGSDISTTSPTTRSAAKKRGIQLDRLNDQGIAASIEAQHAPDGEEEQAANARSKSSTPTRISAKDVSKTAPAAPEDSFSSVNETPADEASRPPSPKVKGRGRWPNGPKAKTSAGYLSKKHGVKKKGAPGKRKTSDNALVQAVYDRQAHLRSQYKDLKKMLLRSELSLLERTLEELEESPTKFMENPYYKDIVDFLGERRTSVIAQREKGEQVEKQHLQRRHDADVEFTWLGFFCEMEDLKVKYEMQVKKEVLNILNRRDEAEDDDKTVEGEFDIAEQERIALLQEVQVEEAPTPAELEPAKKGKPAVVKRRGRKRAAGEPSLEQQIARRHAPAMLSAQTQEEESELDRAETPVPAAAPPLARGKKQYQYDEYGVHIPKEIKKGPQRDEPNNRYVVKPWFEFEEHEIGFRNYVDETTKGKTQFPTGHLHFDQYRGEYKAIDEAPDAFDQKLVHKFGLHPMGIPTIGSRNPDDAFPHTNYEDVVKHPATPLPNIDNGLKPLSRSWDTMMMRKQWPDFEKRMDAGMHLRPVFKQTGLATFDAKDRDAEDGRDLIEELLEASEKIEKETPQPPPAKRHLRTVSPSPKRKSARQKALALKKATPPNIAVTPPPQPAPVLPPITNTFLLSLLADASDQRREEEFVRYNVPRPRSPPARPSALQSYQMSPPTQRNRPQLPHLSFINNPPSARDIRQLAPQPPPPQHVAQHRFGQPAMMGPPPPSHHMPPIPLYPPHQQHSQTEFYGHHSSPPLPQAQPPRNSAPRSNNLRMLAPRAMPGGPLPPHHPHQIHYPYPGPPPQPHHIPLEQQRYYDGPPQHQSPYRSEPYGPGPLYPAQSLPPGYCAFRGRTPPRR